MPPIDAPDAQPAAPRMQPMAHPQLRIGRYPIVLPDWRDPRVHLSIVTVTIFVIGIGWLGFRLFARRLEERL